MTPGTGATAGTTGAALAAGRRARRICPRTARVLTIVRAAVKPTTTITSKYRSKRSIGILLLLMGSPHVPGPWPGGMSVGDHDVGGTRDGTPEGARPDILAELDRVVREVGRDAVQGELDPVMARGERDRVLESGAGGDLPLGQDHGPIAIVVFFEQRAAL